MIKFVPYEKLSKKEKQKLNAIKRETWGLNPTHRVHKQKKDYKRDKIISYDDFQ